MSCGDGRVLEFRSVILSASPESPKVYWGSHSFSSLGLTIAGPSGCGKSTTLRALAGLSVGLIEGEVLFDQQDLRKRKRASADVGLVFQKPQFIAHEPVWRNVGLGLRGRGMRWSQVRERVETQLRAWELSSLIDRSVTHLSGGEAQQLALIRALLLKPRLLLLDEPLAHLDAGKSQKVREYLIQDAKQSGRFLVWVTHDKEEWRSLPFERVEMQIDSRGTQVVGK